jgi:hypothetical protein
MCEVSDKLQLCTCAKIDFDTAKHYWVYHRFVKGQEMLVMGDPILPYDIDEETDLINRQLLITLVNERSVFDKPIHPQEGDLLELSFLLKEEFGRTVYGFKYHNGKWEEEEYDVFKWMAHHKEAKHGKIKNALKNKDY